MGLFPSRARLSLSQAKATCGLLRDLWSVALLRVGTSIMHEGGKFSPKTLDPVCIHYRYN